MQIKELVMSLKTRDDRDLVVLVKNQVVNIRGCFEKNI